jgi:hypothetical protein
LPTLTITEYSQYITLALTLYRHDSEGILITDRLARRCAPRDFETSNTSPRTNDPDPRSLSLLRDDPEPNAMSRSGRAGPPKRNVMHIGNKILCIPLLVHTILQDHGCPCHQVVRKPKRCADTTQDKRNLIVGKIVVLVYSVRSGRNWANPLVAL